jgi:hypothetical protein
VTKPFVNVVRHYQEPDLAQVPDRRSDQPARVFRLCPVPGLIVHGPHVGVEYAELHDLRHALLISHPFIIHHSPGKAGSP